MKRGGRRMAIEGRVRQGTQGLWRLVGRRRLRLLMLLMLMLKLMMRWLWIGYVSVRQIRHEVGERRAIHDGVGTRREAEASTSSLHIALGRRVEQEVATTPSIVRTRRCHRRRGTNHTRRDLEPHRRRSIPQYARRIAATAAVAAAVVMNHGCIAARRLQRTTAR